MRTFLYTGIDGRGRRRNGRMAAVDELSLEESLRAAGVWLVEAKAGRERGATEARWFRVRQRELINFCTLMEFLTKVGMPLVQALELAAQDCERPAWAKVLLDLKRQLEAGLPMGGALERHPGVFRPSFTNLVRAGESSGSLPEAFGELKRHLEWQDQISSEVRQATLYPAAVLVTTGLFVLILFTFVVPKFVALLAVVKVALPWPTRVVFAISDGARATWWGWLAFLGLGPVAVTLLRRKSERFAIACERGWFRVPCLGPLAHLLVAARFARNLAVLYRNGVSLVSALKLVEGLLGSRLASRATADVGRRIEAGESFSEALAHHAVFPSLLVRMARVGERTGQLDDALEKVAAYYDLLVPQRLKRLFSLLEPALILFLVGLVGFVALAVFLPILSLLQNIR